MFNFNPEIRQTRENKFCFGIVRDHISRQRMIDLWKPYCGGLGKPIARGSRFNRFNAASAVGAA
jgi:hypothetical protein